MASSSRVTFAEESTINTFEVESSEYEEDDDDDEELAADESLLGTYSAWLRQSMRGDVSTSAGSTGTTKRVTRVVKRNDTSSTATTAKRTGKKLLFTKQQTATAGRDRQNKKRSFKRNGRGFKDKQTRDLSSARPLIRSGARLETAAKEQPRPTSLVETMIRSESPSTIHEEQPRFTDGEESLASTSSFSFSTAAPTYVTESSFVTIYPFRDCVPIPLQYQCYF